MMTRLGFPALTLASLASLALALAGCGGGESGDSGAIAASCNPLGGKSATGCLAPFPSAIYEVADSSTKTGMRVSFPESGGLLKNVDDVAIDTTYYDRFDGFSPNGLIVVAFSTGVDPATLTGHDQLAKSVTPQSSTIVLDMDTGELMPHFAEVDRNAPDATDQALIIRPVKRLAPGHRIAVAVTTSVTRPGGGALPMSPAFQAAVAGKPFDHPLFARVADRYPDIFAKLAAAGVSKERLVLAWDYTTASDEFLIEDMLTMQRKALTDMGDGASLQFDAAPFDIGNAPHVLRAIKGTYDAPSFLSNGEKDDSILVRGADGLPTLMGRHRYNYAAIIPKCLEADPRPVPVMLFGHGLFGSADGYVDGGLLQRVADEQCVVLIAGDFIGLTKRNIASTAIAINDVNKARGITEKLMQSVVNFMALHRVARTALLNDDLFKVGGKVVIDPTQIWYFGASLGGIMGGALMSYDPAIERGVLGVPGCNWTMCFERSFAWPPLRVALQGAYEGFVKDQEVIALLGMAFDRIDPVTTAAGLVTAPVTGVPAKKILVYATRADSLVTNLATDMLVRTMGIPVMTPSVYEPFGSPLTAMPESQSAMVWFDEKPTPAPSPHNLAPDDDNGTHGGVHDRDAVLLMIEQFLRGGPIENPCEKGAAKVACDCSTGACDRPD
jgi:hypothetical protein